MGDADVASRKVLRQALEGNWWCDSEIGIAVGVLDTGTNVNGIYRRVVTGCRRPADG
jgi:hypothetical protein